MEEVQDGLEVEEVRDGQEVEEEKAQELLECVIIEHPEEKWLKEIENTETRNLVREMYLLTENYEKQKTDPETWATLIAAMSVLSRTQGYLQHAE